MNKELEEKIYSMSNSFLPLDVFYNDIRDNPIENYDKERAYKDIEIIADFIIDLQSQLDHQKARIEELEGQFAYECECNKQFVQLQKMWNELKEWLEKKKSWNERQLKEAHINTEFYIRVSVQGITINKILNKMQELEGEDVED